MFKKILIANRGEIACRVIRTARRMGLATVAVYSEADRDALHVAMADTAVAIGPAAVAKSYLAIDKIVAACVASGADAVHPGYGFLSEQPAFARALAAAGITFIGPNVHAIEAMGDKIASKKYAKVAGVTTVPGFIGTIETAEEAIERAEAIGYPVMIKASAGGGGKGMRIAQSRADVAQGFARARSEAKASFGDDRVFLEKFIVAPRHIEIQVLGDRHGHVIYLGERECSIQRRHQKVVEEAPSPFLDARMRESMGAQAVALARAVGYDSAGTVEFVVSPDKRFYFLEMNTRLQVEHPVTELVTGVDLVETMIRSAAGEPLALRQDEVRFSGWAIETRVYAEDPTHDFLPSTGRLVTYRQPPNDAAEGACLRIDTGVVEGSAISIHYDPMIAKVITHAGDRQAAIEAQATALDHFAIEGIRHNVPFLAALMQHPRWRAGHLSTEFIAEEFPRGLIVVHPQGEAANMLVCVAVAMDHTLALRRRAMSGQTRRRALNDPARAVLLDHLRYDVMAQETGGGVRVEFSTGQSEVCTSDWTPGRLVWSGRIGEQRIAVQARSILNGYRLIWRDVSTAVRVLSRAEADLFELMPKRKAVEPLNALLCPMPGLVKNLPVQVGQKVRAGDALCVIEAMKMENVLRAERDVVVAEIYVREGDSLPLDMVMMEFG